MAWQAVATMLNNSGNGYHSPMPTHCKSLTYPYHDDTRQSIPSESMLSKRRRRKFYILPSPNQNGHVVAPQCLLAELSFFSFRDVAVCATCPKTKVAHGAHV